MGTMDLIASTGNKAANFLDVGGGSDLASISAAIDVLFSDPDVILFGTKTFLPSHYIWPCTMYGN